MVEVNPAAGDRRQLVRAAEAAEDEHRCDEQGRGQGIRQAERSDIGDQPAQLYHVQTPLHSRHAHPDEDDGREGEG